MEPVGITASIIAIIDLSLEVVGYLNVVRNASKDRIKCLVEASNSCNLLVSLRSHREGSSNEPWYNAVRALGVENGPLDQFKQALEQLRTRMIGGGTLNKVGDALIWKFSKKEVTGILGRIERLKSLVQVALELDHFKLNQATKESMSVIHRNNESIKYDIGLIQTHIRTIESGVDGLRQNQDRARQGQNDTQLKKLMEWISATDFPAQQSDFIARRQEGAGQWFRDAPKFKEWLHGPNETLLLCPGIPGAGKTMIAAVLLAAILKQLLQAQPSIAEPVDRLYKQHADRGTKPSLEEIFFALQSVVVKYSSVYVVVDALDECSTRDGTRGLFLAKLRDLQSTEHLRIMDTSRFIPDIEHEFSAALKLEDMVQEEIMQAVDGMFLIAQLYVDSLCYKKTKSLAYDAAMEQIKGQQPEDKMLATNILSWIVHAQRPLTMKELCHALAVQPDDIMSDQDIVTDLEDVVSVCAGLVTVDEDSGIIRLVHYTAQDYLQKFKKSEIFMRSERLPQRA
ncbi:hypothetical protein MMC07_003955 [Pseudocyphellaria aurata]|nr:hypothetical protein [Pseudocyphellaria aurata]